jgi:predicted Zn-dependent protease
MSNPLPARRSRRAVARLLMALTLFASVAPRPAAADDEKISMIRDAETEQLIHSYAEPLWKAAGLDPDAVHFYIIGSNEINAFVAGGQNLFLYTGLILKTDTPNQITGVIAHETGHMAGGHLARREEWMSRMKWPMIVSMLLGIGAAVGGSGGAAGAVLTGSQQIGQRMMAAYSRTQEASADQAGATFLQQAHESGAGLVQVLRKLQNEELLATRDIDPYVIDHPLSEDRIAALEDRVQSSRYYNKKDSPEAQAAYDRMKAKLYGFLQDPARVLVTYPTTNNSIPARYARAVAYHRSAQEGAAMREMDALLTAMPKNPYFWELKGQILFESGHVREAIAPYQKAVDLNPTAGLLRVGLGQAMVATEDPALTKAAIGQLNAALLTEHDYPFAWRQLAMAYAEENNEGMASLASGESAILNGQVPEAKLHARRAMRLLPEGSPDWMQANDILREAENLAKEERRHFGF